MCMPWYYDILPFVKYMLWKYIPICLLQLIFVHERDYMIHWFTSVEIIHAIWPVYWHIWHEKGFNNLQLVLFSMCCLKFNNEHNTIEQMSQLILSPFMLLSSFVCVISLSENVSTLMNCDSIQLIVFALSFLLFIKRLFFYKIICKQSVII